MPDDAPVKASDSGGGPADKTDNDKPKDTAGKADSDRNDKNTDDKTKTGDGTKQITSEKKKIVKPPSSDSDGDDDGDEAAGRMDFHNHLKLVLQQVLQLGFRNKLANRFMQCN